ncbi:MAG: SUMF1/EgtB/PvdO family nonheme iron enzyme [Stenomitos rutilans HA7619-LM2]|jgi:formylglycine-generating enzyme required for sulfatase activity|nr:SUMF1/EgtB/PvdO family nonheme iron enzyme [Stenomitos rutilans HA7619-LM2]
MKDFFISYNRHDKQWAEWIAWTLEEAGYTVVIEVWDFQPGGNFALFMDRAVTEAQITIVVLSERFLQSTYTEPEWRAAFARDPQSIVRKLIPVRVEECKPTGLLAQIVYVDLVGITEPAAKALLLSVLQERTKPAQAPRFPSAVPPKVERVAPEPAGFPEVVHPSQAAQTTPFRSAYGNVRPSGMAGLILRKERKQARYFTEKLGEAIGLDMILVPSGTLLMGSPVDEPERYEGEGPQHDVSISSFFMGRYPVTQAQWRFVAALPQVRHALEPDPSNFKGDNRPVEQVSWYDAVEFCDRLAKYTGRPYCLPSEAEWEYACRAGMTTPFYFGKTLTTEIANYDGKSTYNDGPQGEYREETTRVDQFEIANAFGLCDMHGNVWEWCQDHWHENYTAAPIDGNIWLVRSGQDVIRGGSRRSYMWESPGDANQRVLRGGSWLDLPWTCRSASRHHRPPVNRDDNIGFRVICAAPRTL